MLKTIIVEDDILDFTYLKNLINWEEQGFLLYDKTTTGIEAFETIKEENPDIVITDMNMPGLDGVEVIKYLYHNYPSIKIIVLSGYDDFKYVKQSFKMGALDYILKHNLSPESLLKVLKSVKSSIITERQQDEQKQVVEEQLKTGKNVLIQDFINKLLKEGANDLQEIEGKMNYLNLKLNSRSLVIVVGEFDDYDLIKDRFLPSELNNRLNSFFDMANEIIKDMGEAIISLLGGGRFAVIFLFENCCSEHDIYNRVSATVIRLKSTIKRYLNLTACFAIGEVCNNLEEITSYYRKTEKLLSKKFYEGKDKIFQGTERNDSTPDFVRLSVNDEKKVIELIEALKKEALVEHIKGILTRIRLKEPSIGSAKFIFFSFINIINKIAREYHIEHEKLFGKNDNPYERLNKYDTIEEAMNWILEIYEKLIYYLTIYKINPEYDKITRETIKYIYEHYQQDISLNQLADHVGVNSSYLSRKFKKDCGHCFTEYLNLIRIEQAKLLIKNGSKKIKEIAEEVGFNNYNYFFKVFKDIQGMTPLEYQRYKEPI